jgi:phosphoserine/homoserine phosphotransferase
LIVVSDTFTQFAGPLIEKLGWPTLFCNRLATNGDGTITNYHLRQPDGKKKTILSLKQLNYTTIAIGDSYNDITMLKAADSGILFRPPVNVQQEFPQFPVTTTFDQLKSVMESKLADSDSNDLK